MTLTLARVKELLRYDEGAGVFVRLVTAGGQLPGTIAGTSKGNQDGYVQIKIDGVAYCRHKLVWFCKTGIYPEHDVDHRDLNTANDRWENLRKATRPQNCFNASVRVNNKLRLKGVHQVRGRFRALAAGKHVGYFNTPEEAKQAADARAKEVAGEFFRS